MANMQQQGFNGDADALRRIGIAEFAIVLVGSLMVYWRVRTWMRRFAALAILVWILVLVTMILLALATPIP